MEYEFSKDPVRGGYQAKFSMEHEVFSPWLVDEIGNDQSRLQDLFLAIEQIQQKQRQEVRVEGREYVLTMSANDVTVIHNRCCDDPTNELVLDEALSINNDNFQAECGLDDFSQMLHSWKVFLNS